MRLIDADRFAKENGLGQEGEECGKDGCGQSLQHCQYDVVFTRQNLCEMIDEAPTVITVACAEWVEEPGSDLIVCSNCFSEWNVLDNCTETFKYCPHCGAVMTNFEEE